MNPSSTHPSSFRSLALVPALLCFTIFQTASAEGAVDAAAAEALFNEARKLEKAGDSAGACAKFEESYRLDAAPGTLLNVAECSRRGGKSATAWGQFLEAERLFRRRGDERRAEFAKSKAAELEPRLARVRVLAPDAPPSLVLRRDGVELGMASLGTELPVDPGEHLLSAEAPGFEVLELRFEAAEAELREVLVPKLVPRPEEPARAGPAGSERNLALEDSRDTWRTVGWISAGVGAASLVAGGVFVGLTAERSSAADERCPEKVCDAEGIAIVGEAETFANVANVTVIGGAVLASVGVGLLLFVPSDGPNEDLALRFAPIVAHDRAGLVVGGSF
jgi:hypothetical protein